jgi:hypothetical protein
MPRHYHQALEFLSSKQKLYPFERILSATYPLERTTEAMQAMADYRVVKPVILPHGPENTGGVAETGSARARRERRAS